ncbi:MAG: hypothetical protein SVR81_07435 [Chloroflexota bacterium]|nr:hypothetical protein [Chloroflexota bacterium]
MKSNSRQILYIGINLVSIPTISIDSDKAINFQVAVKDQGLDYSIVRPLPDRIVIQRQKPTSLTISAISPQNQPFSQLIVNSDKPSTSDLFIAETEAAANAFQAVWPTDSRQLIGADATIRELHEASNVHAFKEIWETRLGQTEDSLHILQKLIRGGGLRFVLDPKQEETDPVQVEIKVESYFQNSKKIFLETIFRWLKPSGSFDIRDRLTTMNDYITQRILKFLRGEFDD